MSLLGSGFLIVVQHLFEKRVGEPAPCGDGPEYLVQIIKPAQLHQCARFQLIANDNGRDRRHSHIRPRQQSQHGHIIGFRSDSGHDALTIKRKPIK